LTTFSLPLRNKLLETGPFIAAYPKFYVTVNADRLALKVLPVDLPVRPWPVEAMMLRNRTLNPVVEHFLDHLRAFARSAIARSVPEKKKSA